MSSVSRTIKSIAARLHLLPALHWCLFQTQRWRNRKINQQFKRSHPFLPLPKDKQLYGSFELNHAKYYYDGCTTAAEISEAVIPFLPPKKLQILDWGCGPARITRHLSLYFTTAQITACDIDNDVIAWNKVQFPHIAFEVTNHLPPTEFLNNQFDLIIAFSVLTHIPIALQQSWMEELLRLLQPSGIAWITTHGSAFEQQLNSRTRKVLHLQGMYTSPYPTAGHRMMTTYHTKTGFEQLLGDKAFVLVHYPGESYPDKAGKQDLWILQKKP